MNATPVGRFRFSLRMLFVVVTIPCVLLALAYWQRRIVYMYPYGREHCCDKQLHLSLVNYADEHQGAFPTGGDTPEASLSLLYPRYLDASVLKGKTYPEEPAAKLLAAGLPLTPATCGWHYVDGLTMPKSPYPAVYGRVALFWDKVGCGHNNERLPAGGHTVNFIDGFSRVISEADWPRFVAEQQKAVAAIKQGKMPNPPWLPDENW